MFCCVICLIRCICFVYLVGPTCFSCHMCVAYCSSFALCVLALFWLLRLRYFICFLCVMCCLRCFICLVCLVCLIAHLLYVLCVGVCDDSLFTSLSYVVVCCALAVFVLLALYIFYVLPVLFVLCVLFAWLV